MDIAEGVYGLFGSGGARHPFLPTVSERGDTDRVETPSSRHFHPKSLSIHVKYKLLPIPVTRKPLENYQ